MPVPGISRDMDEVVQGSMLGRLEGREEGWSWPMHPRTGNALVLYVTVASDALMCVNAYSLALHIRLETGAAHNFLVDWGSIKNPKYLTHRSMTNSCQSGSFALRQFFMYSISLTRSSKLLPAWFTGTRLHLGGLRFRPERILASQQTMAAIWSDRKSWRHVPMSSAQASSSPAGCL